MFSSFAPIIFFLLWAIFYVFLLALLLAFIGFLWFLSKPWRFEKRKFHDPQRILVFGRPGKGKTTLGVFEAIKRLRSGEVVISNIGIKWYGSLTLVYEFHETINKTLKKFFAFSYFTKKIKKEKDLINSKIKDLKFMEKNCKRKDGRFKFDLTVIWKDTYDLKEEIKKIEKFEDKIKKGFFKEIFHPKENYIFEEDLGKAIYRVVKIQKESPETKISLIFDEGFSYLSSSKKPPSYITNFINQSRKLNCSILIISQRPVAVFPDFRALVDFMVLVDKGWFGSFSATKYFVDTSSDALPSMDQINSSTGLFGKSETIDTGEAYAKYNGKDVFPFFDTRQSFALNEVLKEFEKNDTI